MINKNYITRLIETSYKLNYDPMKAITEYTHLEIMYSPHPFRISKEAQDKALKEMQYKMLKKYIGDNK
jgi:hypothetical protein